MLDKQRQLDAQSFWDNRDWEWYVEHIPFFECPDSEITTTYYYRWELLTKHLTYGSPNSGYSFTEFIDRPFWSGAYGAISCPAGHQIYEARWLRRPRIARDYLRYWLRTPGAQPRNYSTWLANSAWAVHQVHPERDFLSELLPDLIRNYEGWEQRHFVPQVGLFWQTGHDDGMEFNINSRQTQDIVRGAPSYRPSFNAYMWADAVAIADIARLSAQEVLARRFEQKAAALKSKMQELLWDPQRQFFFPAYRDDEERDGFKIKALSRTYETGRFAGDPHGRELIGFVPWQFDMPDPQQGYEAAWSRLMDPDAFFARFGPTTVERHDPLFVLKKSCCWWSGQSWPYATTQTLKAMANVLRMRQQNAITRADYFTLLRNYALSHRKNGRPYLAEALDPDTGSFEGHDAYNHSEHYFHSGFCDLVITGLAGVVEQSNQTLIVDPLAPTNWEYFALDDVVYHGHRLAVFWDKTGQRYGHGAGLHVMMDGRVVATSPNVGKLFVDLSLAPQAAAEAAESLLAMRLNYAVNNDGDYFPRLTASYVAPQTSLAKVQDGNYWYHQDPPNRWTTAASPRASDWLAIDFGTPRPIDTVKLYVLDDQQGIVAPAGYTMEVWIGNRWMSPPQQQRHPEQPAGHRPNTISFPKIEVEKLRVTFQHAEPGRSGLTELEAWGPGMLPYAPAPPPPGNLASNPRREGFPTATASFTDRFGGHPASAIDGKIIYAPSPMNRWTSYESPNEQDWLEIDFGKAQEVRRVELHIYDDRGGVQPPQSYVIQHFDGAAWREVTGAKMTPPKPTGGVMNTVRFQPVTTQRLRVVFTNDGQARSGVTEIEIWNE